MKSGAVPGLRGRTVCSYLPTAAVGPRAISRSAGWDSLVSKGPADRHTLRPCVVGCRGMGPLLGVTSSLYSPARTYASVSKVGSKRLVRERSDRRNIVPTSECAVVGTHPKSPRVLNSSESIRALKSRRPESLNVL